LVEKDATQYNAQQSRLSCLWKRNRREALKLK